MAGVAPHIFVRQIVGATAGSCKAVTSSTGQRYAERIDLDDRVIGFSYIDSEKKADQIKLEIRNWDLKFFDDPIFRKGSVLEVTWGFTGKMSPPRVAIVQKVTGATTLKVEALDCGVLLNRFTRCESYENTKRSDVASVVAERNGFGTDDQFIEDTEEVEPIITQARLTDAQFMKRLAYKEGYEWFIDFDGFHFHRRQTSIPVLRTFKWKTAATNEEGIITFNIENDITAKPAAIRKKGRCPSKKCDIDETGSNQDTDRTTLSSNIELIDVDTKQTYEKEDRIKAARLRLEAQGLDQQIKPGEAAQLRIQAQQIEDIAALRLSAQVVEPIPDGQLSGETTPTPDDTREKAKRRADGRFRKIQQTAVKMSVNVLGDPTMVAKQLISLEGMGHRISGTYYVKEVTHTIRGQAYVMKMKCISDGHGGHGNRLFEPQHDAKKNKKKPEDKGVGLLESIKGLPEGGKIRYHYINNNTGDRISFDRLGSVKGRTGV